MLFIQGVDVMFSVLVIKMIIILFFIIPIQNIEGMGMRIFWWKHYLGECIAISNFASIRAAEKIGFRKDGFVKKSKILHILSRVKESSTLLYKYDRNINSLGMGKVRYKE